MTCELLVHETKCTVCKRYRPTLRSLLSRKMSQQKSDSTAVSSHTNFRYLNTPEKRRRMSRLKAAISSKAAEVKRKEREIEHLKDRLREATEQHGIFLEKELENDLQKIMEEKTDEISQKYSPDSFHHIFWNQQLEALKSRDRRQIRWHPKIIRWCLSLKLLSSASYHALRSSDVLVLPSERTLRDFTHFVKAKPGFQPEIDEQLCQEAKIHSIPDFQKYVCLVFDEVKVKEDLIYDKHSIELLGFVKIGDINDHLSRYESSATSKPKPPICSHLWFQELCLTWNFHTFPSPVPVCRVINCTRWCGGVFVGWKPVASKLYVLHVMVLPQIVNFSNCISQPMAV